LHQAPVPQAAPTPTPGRAQVEDDHTVMKPVTVVTAGPRTTEPTRTGASTERSASLTGDRPGGRGPVATAAWAAVAVAVLVAVVVGLYVRGDRAEGDRGTPPSPPPTTPNLLPGALDQPPTVRAERVAAGV